jgi:hypothetical protein
MSRFPQFDPTDLLTADAFFVVWTVLFVGGVPSISTVLTGNGSFTRTAVVALWLGSAVFLCAANGVFVVQRVTASATA